MATQGDQDLAKFLKDEIATEKQNSRSLPKLSGWEVKTDGSEVTLTKKSGSEEVMITFNVIITSSDPDFFVSVSEVTLTKKSGSEEVMITLNVNHTVDSAAPDDGTGEAPEMLSKPTFEVDLIKPGGKTLSFTCSYVQEDEHPEGQEPDEEDVFAIDEVTMFEGDNHSDACYAVAGDILDGYLYDLFMNMLAERGVDADFADELSEWCSSHEHGQYINMLSELEKWSKL